MRRQAEIISALGRGRPQSVEVKLSILELIRDFGCLHLSDLKRCLQEQKGTKIGIGTLHKYVRQMFDVGLLKGEKAANKLFISVEDLSVADWLFTEKKRKNQDPWTVSNVIYYINVVKENWNRIRIRSKNKEMSLKQCAPILVLKLTASGLEPFKQILVLNRVAQRLGIGTTETSEEIRNKGVKVTLHHLIEIIRSELKSIDLVSYNGFEKMQMDFETTTQLEEVLKRFIPARGFAAPTFEEFKKALELVGCG